MAPPPSGPDVVSEIRRVERAMLRWRAVRRAILFGVLALALGSGLWMFFGGSQPGVAGRAQAGGMAALAVGLFGWFFLVYAPNYVFLTVLWLAKGKCPACRTQLKLKSRVIPGGMSFGFAFPESCPACGVKFTMSE